MKCRDTIAQNQFHKSIDELDSNEEAIIDDLYKEDNE